MNLRSLLLIFASTLSLVLVEGFGLSHHHSGRRYSPIVCRSTFDYEYIPPNPNASPREEKETRASSYPEGTPASLRGEAVRSALLSGRCIGWELTQDPHMITGMIQIQGKGMRNFLNNKLTQNFSSVRAGSYNEGCLLDAKGRVVDRLKVAGIDDDTSLLLTSPGHSSESLFQRLDPFIFPMDEIKMTHLEDSFQFSLASIQWADVVKAFSEQATSKEFKFPTRITESVVWDWDDDGTKVLVIPVTGLSEKICVGFTFAFFGGEAAARVGKNVWEYLIGEGNSEGPIAIGALEYETLRIEAGTPAFGNEIGDGTKTAPLELFWQDAIDMEKGCYLGQEGVASMHKNPRGPARTLYSVVFEDDFNVYETQSRGDKSDVENLTVAPRPGDKLFALGSDEQLTVGELTSVAEPGGTGRRETVALALVRRPDTILKQMKELDLEIHRPTEDMMDIGEASGMIEPPPLDPLDGLEVIVGGSYTIGKLKMIPSRGIRAGRNKFDPEVAVKDYFDEDDDLPETSQDTPESIQATQEDSLEQIQADAEAAEKEAQAAAAEAKRKAEKMELLKKRAEEAMARRKQKKQ